MNPDLTFDTLCPDCGIQKQYSHLHEPFTSPVPSISSRKNRITSTIPQRRKSKFEKPNFPKLNLGYTALIPTAAKIQLILIRTLLRRELRVQVYRDAHKFRNIPFRDIALISFVQCLSHHPLNEIEPKLTEEVRDYSDPVFREIWGAASVFDVWCQCFVGNDQTMLSPHLG